MKRNEIMVGKIYRGVYALGREHLRRVDAINERPTYSADTHVVTYSRLYKAGWSGGFICTLAFFATWAKGEAE